MIDKVINTILEAEERAEEILRDAHARAKDIILGAEDEASALKNDAMQSMKQKLGEVNQRAEADGEKYYVKAISGERLEAEKKYGNIDKDKLANIVVGKYLARYEI